MASQNDLINQELKTLAELMKNSTKGMTKVKKNLLQQRMLESIASEYKEGQHKINEMFNQIHSNIEQKK